MSLAPEPRNGSEPGRSNGSGEEALTKALPEASPACSWAVAAFDFDVKRQRPIDVSEALSELSRGAFVWIDAEVHDPKAALSELMKLGLVTEDLLEEALQQEPITRYARFDEYFHLVVSGCRRRGHHFDLERVDIYMGENFLLTVHRGPVIFLSAVKKDYAADFLRFAKSPSFLLYEVWDHLLDNYLSIQKQMEERVEQVQLELRVRDVNDVVFTHISELGADLLHFRKVLLPARTVLSELSTRKSIFISEATQPFLGNMVGTVEHVLQDLLVDRDILSESLNLYMSMVSHRTNAVMKRLTTVSVLFLPLTFLVGVYGMNFDIPEHKWPHGYAFFWALVVLLVTGITLALRRAKLF